MPTSEKHYHRVASSAVFARCSPVAGSSVLLWLAVAPKPRDSAAGYMSPLAHELSCESAPPLTENVSRSIGIPAKSKNQASVFICSRRREQNDLSHDLREPPHRRGLSLVVQVCACMVS